MQKLENFFGLQSFIGSDPDKIRKGRKSTGERRREA
jgi:hypothetical protein